ncbi:MAG: PP2C family protein-serine/threonine phosphatase [Desulfotomaculales bacterium]
MSLTQGLLHSGAARRSSPGQLLTHVNRLLAPVMPRGMFVTMTYLVLEPRGRACRLASAGGLSPLLIRPATGELAYLEVPGFPLGTMGDLTYQDREFPLEPGDILLLYSDGLIEAVNARGEFFGFGRLEESARRAPPTADLFLDRLLEEIGAFTGGATQYDDTTLVVIQRRREGEER